MEETVYNSKNNKKGIRKEHCIHCQDMRKMKIFHEKIRKYFFVIIISQVISFPV